MKKRKKFKGMTLMEIIISLAVLAVLTLILVQTSSTINMYIRSANTVNKKTAQQAPLAEIGYKDAGELVQENVTIHISGFDNNNGGKKLSVDVQGDAYKVGDSSTGDELGGNLNMQYIVDLEAITTTAPSPGP